MKKSLSLLFAVFFLFSFTTAARATSGEQTDVRNKYEDKSSGVSLIIPEKWTEEDISGSKGVFTVRFVSPDDPDKTISFGAVDVWNLFSKTKTWTTDISFALSIKDRSYIDDTKLTFTKAARILSCVDSEAATLAALGYSTNGETKHGGIHYFSFVARNVRSDSIETEYRIHFEQGWMYIFSFSGQRTDPEYKEFISMMSGVRIKVPPISAEEVNENNAKAAKQESERRWITGFVIAVIIIYVVGSVFLIIKRGSYVLFRLSYAPAAFFFIFLIKQQVQVGLLLLGVYVLLCEWLRKKCINAKVESTKQNGASKRPLYLSDPARDKFDKIREAIAAAAQVYHPEAKLRVMDYAQLMGYLKENRKKAEEFCGRSVSKKEILYWVSGTDPQRFFFCDTVNETDFSDQTANELIGCIGISKRELAEFSRKTLRKRVNKFGERKKEKKKKDA